MNIKHVAFKAKNTFGLEIELNKNVSQNTLRDAIVFADKNHSVHITGWAKTNNNNYWHIKTDSTCGDTGKKQDGGGFEVASYIAKGHKDISNIGNVITSIYNIGAKTNKYCGLHIHVGVDDRYNYVNMVSRWLKIEHIFYESVPEFRRNNKYCRPLRNKLNIHKKLDLSSRDLSAILLSHNYSETDRRVALNIYNYINGIGRTLELRLPESTLNSLDVKNWSRIFINFINKSHTTYFSDLSLSDVNETLVLLGLTGEGEFFILSKTLLSVKKWFLRRLIRYSFNPSYVLEAKRILKNIS